MRSLLVLAGMATLLPAACVTAVEDTAEPRPAFRYSHEFDLVSLGGKALPLELPNGDTLSSGYCGMSAPNRDGWVSFSISLRFPSQSWWGSPRGGLYLDGLVWDDDYGGREPGTHIVFVQYPPGEEDSTHGKFSDFPLGWRDGMEARGLLQGDTLTLGDRENALVFVRRD